MSLITSIEADATEIGAWFKKEFVVVETNFLPLAVTVTQYAKKAEDSGVIDAIALALSPDTNGLSVSFNNDAKALITQALAIELQLEAVPANATAEQLGATASSIDTAVTGLAPKPLSQFLINLGVIALNVFKKLTGQTEAATWMEDAIAVQTSYNNFVSGIAVPVTPVPQGEPAEQTPAEASKEGITS